MTSGASGGKRKSDTSKISYSFFFWVWPVGLVMTSRASGTGRGGGEVARQNFQIPLFFFGMTCRTCHDKSD